MLCRKDKVNDMFPKLKRNRYFFGRILSAEDFETEQRYFINRQKLHNRFLHGYGVVTGLQVTPSNDGSSPAVIVSPGYALDAQGNEIIVSTPQSGPLPEKGEVAYLCIRWAERETDYLPVPGNTTGSQDPAEASAIEEYAILEYECERPSIRQNKPDEEGPGAGNQNGIALARLIKKHGGWKIDKRFRPHRVCAEK
jgi:hypothetical protein